MFIWIPGIVPKPFNHVLRASSDDSELSGSLIKPFIASTRIVAFTERLAPALEVEVFAGVAAAFAALRFSASSFEMREIVMLIFLRVLRCEFCFQYARTTST